jgi:hypothetical protein
MEVPSSIYIHSRPEKLKNLRKLMIESVRQSGPPVIVFNNPLWNIKDIIEDRVDWGKYLPKSSCIKDV